MRVLQIEDDSSTAQSVELMLKSEGFSIYTTDLGEEGIDLAKVYDYDIILLDLNLPDISGLEVLRALRSSGLNTPIMIVTGSNTIETKVKTFTAGADDFLGKPFHKDELVARIHAIVRRSRGIASPLITSGNIAINLDERSARVAGIKLHLTSREWQLLQLLALRKGTVVSKSAIMQFLYGDAVRDPKVVDVYICKLRRKLEDADGDAHHAIETVYSEGYRFAERSPAAALP